ncbi:MAG: methyltransferase domain-containing protein [Anaerolineaceae bacterium]|nr:methyltransferase domain-containing protein [Anaerolineaceae bacterium]
MSSKESASNSQLFIRQFMSDFFHMGAVLPSSHYLGQAGAAYLTQKQGRVDVLEVGSGTGSFTREIAPLLDAGDRLDMVEINTDLIAYLRRRFETEPAFQLKPGVTANFINSDVRGLAGHFTYDYIVFSLPLTNFPPEMVQSILNLMIERLKPGGVFSYVKYAFISRFKYLLGGAATRSAMKQNQEIIRSFAQLYQIEQRLVWRNVPPAWTFYWQKPDVN